MLGQNKCCRISYKYYGKQKLLKYFQESLILLIVMKNNQFAFHIIVLSLYLTAVMIYSTVLDKRREILISIK
jgi:hypothetical protein